MSVHAQPSPASIKPSSLGSDFLKFFTNPSPPNNANINQKTRDGQPAKRRGPKPDSKPAMTRRQELNRQAQRTHRERKEQYMRALETEVSRLREAYTHEISAANLALHQHRIMAQSLTEDNEILRDILSSHGIAFEAELQQRRRADRPPVATTPPLTDPNSNASAFAGHAHAGSTTSPLTGSMASTGPSVGHTNYTPPTTMSSSLSPREGPEVSPQPEGMSHGIDSFHMDRSVSGAGMMGPVPGPVPVQTVPGIFESDPQLQVDFILTLESPCREHTDYLCRRSVTEADDEDMPFSGHALMATCPPPSYIDKTTNESPYPHKTYDLPLANLSTLLNLSRQLVTDGQITPIMALQCLKHHDLYRSLTRDDVKIIMDTLNNKVRCYGFGAVVEDFELADCLSNVLGTKVDPTSQDELMYS